MTDTIEKTKKVMMNVVWVGIVIPFFLLLMMVDVALVVGEQMGLIIFWILFLLFSLRPLETKMGVFFQYVNKKLYLKYSVYIIVILGLSVLFYGNNFLRLQEVFQYGRVINFIFGIGCFLLVLLLSLIRQVRFHVVLIWLCFLFLSCAVGCTIDYVAADYDWSGPAFPKVDSEGIDK